MRQAALLIAVLAIATPAGSADRSPDSAVGTAVAGTGDDCRRANSYVARNGLEWRGDRLTPRKLTELPQAVGYMAVYREIDGCEVPMTVVEYRTGRRQ